MKKLSIIIPAYNEERSIVLILEKIARTELVGKIGKEILIIDDGSKDLTSENASNLFRLIRS